MKEFFKPTKFNAILTGFLILIAILVVNGSLSAYNLGYWVWGCVEFILNPLDFFRNFGLWLLNIINPDIKYSAEPITYQLRAIQYLIVWPLMLIYFYSLSCLIEKIYIFIKRK